MSSSKRELLLDLLARDKTKQATDSAAKNLDNVGDSADDASKSTDKLAKSTVGAADGAEKLGKKATENADRIGKLNREIGLADAELKTLAKSFADTDDAAERLDLSKAVRALENDLRRLNKNKGLLEGILPDPAPAAKDFMSKLGAGIAEGSAGIAAKAGTSVGPVVGAAIGAAAAPIVVSALSSALSAGAGAGVLGAGVMAAVNADKGIQSAGITAGQRFSKALGENAVTSLRGPILKSLGIVSDAGDRLNADLGRTFAEIGDDLVPLTRKFVGAGEAVSGSLLEAARNSGPALDGLGDSVTLLGDGVADFVDILADGGPEAASNLRLIAGATADLARYTATTLDQLSKLANNAWITGPLIPLLRKHYEDAANASDDLTGSNAALAPGLDESAEAATASAKAVADAAMSYDELAESMNKVTSIQQELYGSEVDVREAVIDATRAIQENGSTIDLNTEKGRNNRAALLDLAQALGKDNDAYRGVNGVSAQTTAHMEANRAAFVKAAIAAGYGAGEAKKLADKLLGIPVKTEARVSLGNYRDTSGKLNGLLRDLEYFDGNWTANMYANYEKFGKPGSSGGLAAGGLVHGPGTETSDSVPMMLSKNEYVVPAHAVKKPGVLQMLEALKSGGGGTQAGASGAAGGGWSGPAASGGVQTVRVVFDVTGGDDDLKKMIRKMIRYGGL